MGFRRRMFGVLCAASLCAGACETTDLVGDNSPRSDATQAPLPNIDTLDLLFVIDNSVAMATHQEALAQTLPGMLRTLLSGDVDGDGRQEFRPVVDMNLAVVSTDMGAPGVSGLADCGEDTGRPLGDDGVFLAARPDAVVLGETCGNQPLIRRFRQGTSAAELDDFVRASGCYATIGTAGCRHAMPLEAVLKALSTGADGSLPFVQGAPHGSGLNAGFLRPNALLGVIVVTADDDCSAADTAHLKPVDQLLAEDPDHPMARVGPDMRCIRYPDHLHPLSRYQDGFSTLKPEQLSRVFFGVIGGVPSDLAADLRAARVETSRRRIYRVILDDVRMQQVSDPELSADQRVRRACGDAAPPRRLVEFSRRLEAQSTVASICDEASLSLNTMMISLVRLLDPETML